MTAKRSAKSLLSIIATLAFLAVAGHGTAQSFDPTLSIVEQWYAFQETGTRTVPAANQSHPRLIFVSSEEAKLLLDRHIEAGMTCQDCHTSTLTENDAEHPPVFVAPSFESCVACHGTMLEPADGAEISWPDPHISPHLGPGEVPQCLECHKVHEPGEVTCNFCHRAFDFQLD